MSSGNGAVEQNAEAPARDEEETVEALTLDKAEKLVVGLEKKINENIRQRMKHKGREKSGSQCFFPMRLTR